MSAIRPGVYGCYSVIGRGWGPITVNRLIFAPNTITYKWVCAPAQYPVLQFFENSYFCGCDGHRSSIGVDLRNFEAIMKPWPLIPNGVWRKGLVIGDGGLSLSSMTESKMKRGGEGGRTETEICPIFKRLAEK